MIHLHRIRNWLKGSLAWVTVPILAGQLKGCWFGLFAGSRFIRGTYGTKETQAFEQLLRPGDVVFDIGAHVGYFTLLASRIVGASGKVFAFEPSPLNLIYLRSHQRANRSTNICIFPVAVGRITGAMPFNQSGGTGRGKLASDGSLQVDVVNLDALLESGQVPGPNLIKMDIEGFEGEALRGAVRVLTQYRPKILLSTHGPAAKRDCEAFLLQLGYQLSYFKQSTIIAVPTAANDNCVSAMALTG